MVLPDAEYILIQIAVDIMQYCHLNLSKTQTLKVNLKLKVTLIIPQCQVAGGGGGTPFKFG